MSLGQTARITASSWQSSDIRLCAFLKMRGHKIAQVVKVGREVQFTFEQVGALAEDVRKFYNREEPFLEYLLNLGVVRDLVSMALRGETMIGETKNGTGKP